MDRLKGLEVLVAIVDQGGFSRAAERLGLSPTMVSLHLARLEDRLGVRLVNRSTRRFALTPEGDQFVEAARNLLEAMLAAETAVKRGSLGPTGRVAIDAPTALGMKFIVPALPKFRAKHPGVAVDLTVGDRRVAQRYETADLLIRVGSPNDTKGEVVTLAQTKFVQVASPAYLAKRGIPTTPDDLHDHDSIIYTSAAQSVGQWRFWRDGERRMLRPRSVASFNHGDAIAGAALADLGIAQTLEILVAADLRAGKLVAVLTDWNTDLVDIHMFIPADRLRRRPVQAAHDFLRDEINWNVD